MRARLIAAHGSAANQVILIQPAKYEKSISGGLDALTVVNQWLDRIDQDKAPGSRAEKVARNRPPGLDDTCWTPQGERISGPSTYQGKDRCSELYPAHAGPRIAAGGPLSDDVLKCSLKPVDAGDYRHRLTPAQLEQLRRIFPQGVCDYSKPGMGQHRPAATWRTY